MAIEQNNHILFQYNGITERIKEIEQGNIKEKWKGSNPNLLREGKKALVNSLHKKSEML